MDDLVIKLMLMSFSTDFVGAVILSSFSEQIYTVLLQIELH